MVSVFRDWLSHALYALFKPSMLIFFILSIASMTRFDFSGLAAFGEPLAIGINLLLRPALDRESISRP